MFCPADCLTINESNHAPRCSCLVDGICDCPKPFFRMKPFFRSFINLPSIALAAALLTVPVLAKSDSGNVTTSVGRLLEEGHYTHQALNDEVSKKFLKTYLELLDFSHLFFTQQDVAALTSKYGVTLDDDVLLGNLKPAYEIYDLYTKRVDDRVAT